MNALASTAYDTIHTFTLKPLEKSTRYYFTIQSEDRLANSTFDDNGGKCYTFQTTPLGSFHIWMLTGCIREPEKPRLPAWNKKRK